MSRHPQPGIRENIHAGITAGLAGAYDKARRHLALAAEESHTAPWVDVLKRNCAELTSRPQPGGDFEAEMAAIETRTRRAVE